MSNQKKGKTTITWQLLLSIDHSSYSSEIFNHNACHIPVFVSHRPSRWFYLFIDLCSAFHKWNCTMSTSYLLNIICNICVWKRVCFKLQSVWSDLPQSIMHWFNVISYCEVSLYYFYWVDIYSMFCSMLKSFFLNFF